MRNTTLKKALSIFLAVLMIALALPLTLLPVSAEDDIVLADTVITKVTSTSNGRTSGGVTYPIDWGYDNDLTTTYLGTDASKRFAVTDGVFGSGSTYQDYITVEFNVLSNVRSFTIWAGGDKASKSFTNHEFDVYYSADGETWTLHSEHKNVCGDGTNAGAGSAAFTEEALVGESTYYGLKLDMNNAVAKYVRIAIKKGRVDRGWAVLRDVEVDGTEINVPVSVAGVQQNANGDVRLIGATGSMKVEGVGFKLDATYTYEEITKGAATTIVGVASTNGAKATGGVTYLLDWAIDGDLTTSYIASNEPSLRYGVTDGVFGDGDTYRDYITVELSALSNVNSVTIWASDEEESKAFDNNAFDVYYSADGENWTLYSEHRNVCGNGSTPGEGFADYTEERLVYWEEYQNSYTHFGLKLDINDEAKYIRIAVIKGRVDKGWAMLRDIEVDGTEKSGDVKTITKTASITTDATNVVFNSILADGKNVTAKDIDSELYSDGHKLYALGITGIPTDGEVTLEVAPYFIAFGSTVKVYGDSATFEFIDGKAPNYSEKVKVMSYNICNQNDDDLGTLNERYTYIAAQINSVEPDIVILNEAHEYGNHIISQDLNISKLTAECTVNYGIVEFKAEKSSNVILYNTAKYNLIKSEYLDLGYGKAGEFDADWKRDAVIANLKRISDNREIVAVATHISTSNYSTQIGSLLMHVRDTYGDVAYRIVAGDLNIQNKDLYGSGSSTGHKGRFQNPDFTDISFYDVNVIANGENVDTTSTFPSDSTVLDYIYTTNFTAKNYQVLTGANASKASDHNAVYAELTLN